ncbi:MAG: dTMP kinase [Acetobacteraceae bacterium]
MSGVTPGGRLITLEGGEGAGKSTQARMLADALCDVGLPVLRTREPGGAPGAEFLREVLLSGRIDWSAAAETMLHVAARLEHVAKTIRPAIEAGTWVVCDRFHDSTMAYQGYGLGVDLGMIETLGTMVGIVPDLTLVLDVPREVALARLRGRGGVDDRYERLNDDFHRRVYEGFRAIAAEARCVLVDAAQDAATVHEAVMAAVRKLLP